MTYNSSTARTNGSPLPKRHARRVAIGTRGTLLHSHECNLRGGLRFSSQPNARRPRSEPIGTATRDRGAKSPTSLSPTVTNWPTKTQTQSPPTSPCPATKAAPLMSYAAVAKLANNKPPPRPFPPPQFPIAADLAKIKLNGNRTGNRNGNGQKDIGLTCQPAANLPSSQNSTGAKVEKPGYITPKSRGSTRQQDAASEDGGALLNVDDLPMPDITRIEIAEIPVPIELHQSGVESIEIEPVEIEPPTISKRASPTDSPPPLETPIKKARIGNVSPFDKITPSKPPYPTFAGTDSTTPSTHGFYSPVMGAASRLGFDQSPFFPKTQAEYESVLNKTDAAIAKRNRRRTNATPTSTFLRPPWGPSEEGRRMWEMQSETANIMYKELDGPMQSLLDYIDHPET